MSDASHAYAVVCWCSVVGKDISRDKTRFSSNPIQTVRVCLKLKYQERGS